MVQSHLPVTTTLVYSSKADAFNDHQLGDDGDGLAKLLG
jgi:hypothetical protein